MTSGVKKGIDIIPAAAAALRLLGAGGADGAHVLHDLLREGAVGTTTDAFEVGVAVLWAPYAKGPLLATIDEEGRVVAAVMRPYDTARLNKRARRGDPVDPRGPLEPPDDLSPWFSDEGKVDVYNTEVLAVADLTNAWPRR